MFTSADSRGCDDQSIVRRGGSTRGTDRLESLIAGKRPMAISKRIFRNGALGVALTAGALAVVPASATPVLPDPGTVVSGIPVAVQYDDAYSYSIDVLNYLYPDAGWDSAAGTGNLDVIVTTRSSGQTNPSPLPDPTTNPNTSPINDSWGTSDTTGDLLVQDLYNYLQSEFNANTPVFTFDQNETGGSPGLLASAKVDILDGDGSILYTWSFDDVTQPGDGDYDPDSPVSVSGEICIPDVLNNPADTICFNQNRGSGHFDYILFVPTMDLTPWVDDDNLFRMTWAFDEVDDGGEEITLTGAFQGTQVTEPNLLALLGLGLMGLALGARRRA